MKRSTEYISGAAVVLFLVAAVGWLLCLAKLNTNFSVMRINYLFLALSALAAYTVNCLLMRRGVALQLYAALQFVLIGGAVYVFLHSVVLEPMRLRTIIIICILYALVIPASGFVAYEAPKQSTLQLIFDVSATLTAILLILSCILELPAARSTVCICAAALLLSLIALISERAGRYHAGQESVRGSGVSGKLLLGIIFAAVVGLTAAIAAVASVGIHRASAAIVAALKWTWGIILSILRWVYRMIEAFFIWLSQFFTPDPMEAIPGTEMAAMPDLEIEQMEAVLPPWVKWAAIAIGIALLALLFWKLRKHRFDRVQKVVLRKPTMARRENNASRALRELLHRFAAELRFRLNCVLKRNTAPGLLVWCERKAPRKEARRSGESGEEFLRRLAETPEREALRELASLVEQSFYAPKALPVPRELVHSVRKIKFT